MAPGIVFFFWLGQFEVVPNLIFVHWLDSEADVDLEVLQFPHPETSAVSGFGWLGVLEGKSNARELSYQLCSCEARFREVRLQEWITFKGVYPILL